MGCFAPNARFCTHPGASNLGRSACLGGQDRLKAGCGQDYPPHNSYRVPRSGKLSGNHCAIVLRAAATRCILIGIRDHRLRCVSGPRRARSAGCPTPAKTSETLQGSRIPEPRLISTPRWPGIQPRPTIPSRLSFPPGFSNGYRRSRNTGFIRSTRSEITRRTEKEPAFIRSTTA